MRKRLNELIAKASNLLSYADKVEVLNEQKKELKYKNVDEDLEIYKNNKKIDEDIIIINEMKNSLKVPEHLLELEEEYLNELSKLETKNTEMLVEAENCKTEYVDKLNKISESYENVIVPKHNELRTKYEALAKNLGFEVEEYGSKFDRGLSADPGRIIAREKIYID